MLLSYFNLEHFRPLTSYRQVIRLPQGTIIDKSFSIIARCAHRGPQLSRSSTTWLYLICIFSKPKLLQQSCLNTRLGKIFNYCNRVAWSLALARFLIIATELLVHSPEQDFYCNRVAWSLALARFFNIHISKIFCTLSLIKLTTTSSTFPSALRSQHPSPSPHSRLLYVRSKLKEASCDSLILATEKCVFNAGLNPAFSSSLIMLSTAYIRPVNLELYVWSGSLNKIIIRTITLSCLWVGRAGIS